MPLLKQFRSVGNRLKVSIFSRILSNDDLVNDTGGPLEIDTLLV